MSTGSDLIVQIGIHEHDEAFSYTVLANKISWMDLHSLSTLTVEVVFGSRSSASNSSISDCASVLPHLLPSSLSIKAACRALNAPVVKMDVIDRDGRWEKKATKATT